MLFVTSAPSGILSSQTMIRHCWPTPAGFGETFTKAYVGICHEGTCACAVGNADNEIPIDVNRIVESKIIISLVFDVFIYFPRHLFRFSSI